MITHISINFKRILSQKVTGNFTGFVGLPQNRKNSCCSFDENRKKGLTWAF